eukprot:GFYU01005291.1.p1 GENE.GFYU01005291.1~~GFYU01005291.1.p1  ORF type:complete len:115 (-),score=19.35 GFYU01005291.1:415-759(-)
MVFYETNKEEKDSVQKQSKTSVLSFIVHKIKCQYDWFERLKAEHSKKPESVRYDLDLSHAAMSKLFPESEDMDPEERHEFYMTQLRKLVQKDADSYGMAVLDRRSDYETRDDRI